MVENSAVRFEFNGMERINLIRPLGETRRLYHSDHSKLEPPVQNDEC
jgi:hypothetical protein